MTAALLRCQRDSYLRTISTVVKSCAPHAKGGFLVELEDTVLFPEGGGQPSDRGTIGTQPIIDVFRHDGSVFHHLKGEVPLDSEVVVEVDWHRRFDHMVQHTAQHLVSALALEHFNAKTVSWQLGKSICYIDLDKPFDTKMKAVLEEYSNVCIRQCHPVSYVELSPDKLDSLPEKVRSRGVPTDVESIRLVHIEGVDMNTCCGTHVSNLSELQMVKLTSVEFIKKNTRLYFLAGNRLREASQTWADREKEMNSVLHCGPEDHIASAVRQVSQVKEAIRASKRLLKEISSFMGDKLAQDAGAVVECHREDADMAFLHAVAKQIRAANATTIIFLTAGSTSNGGCFLLSAPADFIGAHSREIVGILKGKGGGKGGVVQGKCSDFKTRAEALRRIQELCS